MVNTYRRVALIEGISYLILLFIAMPLKYIFSIPELVKYVGWAHGVLFVAYITLLLACWVLYKWSFLRVVMYFGGSLIPFLPFVFEKALKKEYGGLKEGTSHTR
jgi:integral membrane protein